MNDLLNRNLPKWPQLYTTGTPVTVDQAQEIIRRTDSFFTLGCGGNDDAWDADVMRRLGMPSSWRHTEFGTRTSEQRHFEVATWHRAWQCVVTSYVSNDWLSCCFVNGPHGWCHPDGTIGFVDNVGKWPSVNDVLADWQKISKAFPFLDVGATLWNCEDCQREDQNQSAAPIVSFQIRRGGVEVVDPATINVHQGHAPARRSARDDSEDVVIAGLVAGDLTVEHGIPAEWIRQWEDRFFPRGGSM
jgi:hypothetical protein